MSEHELMSERDPVPDDLKEFGPLLAKLRAERDWPQVKLAQAAGLDPSSISRFEAGTRMPERDTILKLAEVMVLPVVDRERLLAAAGFRSSVWDDPDLATLAAILADPALPPERAANLRGLLRIAIEYGKI